MRRPVIALTIIACIAIVSFVCWPSSESVALKRFQAEILILKNWFETETAKNKGRVVGTLKHGREITSRLSAVRTDGLPQDLAKAFKRAIASQKSMMELLREMPETEAKAKPWLTERLGDPEFSEILRTHSKEAEAAGDELSKAGKKYGIDGLDYMAEPRPES
ncbi:MAG TPA: hypothetical protein VG796_14880 [Verrucomicrobiales bacterium]|nr:hypothetical protein [Verrucomicrobiales bacterium]